MVDRQFVLEPRYSFTVQQSEYVIGLLFYVTIGGGSMLLFNQLRIAKHKADANAAEAQRKNALLLSETQVRQGHSHCR